MSTTDPRIVASVDTQAAVVDSITKALVQFLRALFHALVDPTSPTEVARFTAQAGAAVTAARRSTTGVSDAYARQVLQIIDVPAPRVLVAVPDLPRGIPLEVEYARPAAEYRRARFLGFDEQIARERGASRLDRIAQMDVALAQRDATQARFAAAEDVTGWRRVIHPELSKGGTCGLCVAAADRIYRKADLMPLHDRCHCTVVAVTATADPGSPLNRDSLNALYRAVGGTGRQALATARFRVEQHGELGPVLVDARDAFRGPDLVSRQAPDLAEVAHAELAAMEVALAGLEARAVAGEDVSGPLAWQRDRIDNLRALSAA